MKLYWKLHETTELHTDLSPEKAEETVRAAVGMQFHGKAVRDGFLLSHNDKNLFRPSLLVKTLPDEGGALVTAEYCTDKMLLIFMCFWSLVVIACSIWKGWLLLFTLLLFWGAVLVGFSIGIKSSNQDLMDLLNAYEIVG